MFIFSDQGRNDSKRTIQHTWNGFRESLAAKRFSYDQLDLAKEQSTFLNVFDQMFTKCHPFFDCPIEKALSNSTNLLRAARIKQGDPEPDYNRFIPDGKYITNHNRFSPPGQEWLYLSIGELENAEKCALTECRASEGETFGLCNFQLNNSYSGRQLIDLTIADAISYQEIDAKLENAIEAIKNAELSRIATCFEGEKSFEVQVDCVNPVLEWVAHVYAKLLSSQIFLPVEKADDKELMYSPFQCMAQYFKAKGYEGIVYSSTVYNEGKNVVLFHKDAAIPFGTIRKRTYHSHA